MGEKMYVASETFTCNIDGVPHTILRGREFVLEDSELYQRFPQFFRPAEDTIRRSLEQATRAPGEKRAVA